MSQFSAIHRCAGGEFTEGKTTLFSKRSAHWFHPVLQVTPDHWPRPRVMSSLSNCLGITRGRGGGPRDFRKLWWCSCASHLEKGIGGNMSGLWLTRKMWNCFEWSTIKDSFFAILKYSGYLINHRTMIIKINCALS